MWAVTRVRVVRDCGYIVNVEMTGFLRDWIWVVRGREASGLTPNGLAPAIGRMELPFNEVGKAEGGTD